MADKTPEEESAAKVAAVYSTNAARILKASEETHKKIRIADEKASAAAAEKVEKAAGKIRKEDAAAANKDAGLKKQAAIKLRAEEDAARQIDLKERMAAKKEGIIEDARSESTSGRLAKEISSKKEDATKAVDMIDLGKHIEKLAGTMGMDATKESEALQAEFKNVSTQLENPELTPLEREALEIQLDNVGAAANDEEVRREKQKAVDDNANLLNRMGNGIQDLGDSFDKFASGMVVGGGIMAALGVIAMMFFKPEELMQGITLALAKVKDIIEAIRIGLEHGWSAGFTAMEDHMGTVAAIIGGIVLLFGGTIIRGLGTVFELAGGLASTIMKFAKAVLWVGRALKAAALLTGSVLMSMLSAIGAFLAPFAIPIAIALAIAVVIGLIAFALTKLRDSLGFESVWDVIWLGVAYLKDGMAHLANLYIDLGNMIMGLVNKFGKWLGFEFEMPKLTRLATNNAETFKAEVLQRQAEEKAEAQEKEGLAAEKAAETKKLEQQDNLTTTTTMTNDMKVDQMNSMNTQDSSFFNKLFGGSDMDFAIDGGSPFDDAISGSGTPSADRLEAEQTQLTKTQTLINAAAQPSNTIMSNSNTSNDNSARTYVTHNTVVKPSRNLYSPAW